MTDTVTEPQLQAPGAGLPPVEAFLTRVGFRLGTPFMSRTRASRWFRAEADRVLALVRGLDATSAARRVLVPRLNGLEGLCNARSCGQNRAPRSSPPTGWRDCT